MNNAGASFFGILESFTPETARKQFDVNVLGPLRVNRTAVNAAFAPIQRGTMTALGLDALVNEETVA